MERALYGASAAQFPRRVVCLTSETVEVCYALGAGERVVGVPGTAQRPPESRDRPRVGGFTSFKTDKILDLQPDLVVGFSDLQADAAAELVRAGLPVLVTNQRSIDEILQSILMIGGVLGLASRAQGLVQDLRDEIRQIREFSSVWPHRPRVYFEEWHDPLIAGIRWVSEAIEIAGGHDVFAELRDRRSAKERVVTPEEVVKRDPQIILASWCGKPVDPGAICTRPGWDQVSAVRDARIHELPGADILSPGPSIVAGIRIIHEIIQAFMEGR